MDENKGTIKHFHCYCCGETLEIRWPNMVASYFYDQMKTDLQAEIKNLKKKLDGTSC